MYYPDAHAQASQAATQDHSSDSRQPGMGDVARLLAMDPTTLSANVKPLERAGLLEVQIDEVDRRARRLALTAAGHELLTRAVPICKRTHARLDRLTADPKRQRADLLALSGDSGAKR
jgi:DNA-binding MarR family transcriptional regulator